jgi:cytochrome c
MDSFEINKLLGALLGTVFIVFSVSLLADTIFYSPTPATPGYQIEVPEVVAEAVDDVEEGPSVLELIANADPAAGESAFRRCVSCHTAEEGGPNRVGPNLWNTVMQPITHAEGFNYSSAMREFAAQEEIWTYEHLAGFLENPRGYVPGTTMAFAGIRDVQEKANLIAYMRTLSDDPAPLPEVAEEAPAEEEAETEVEPVEPAPEDDGTAVGPEPDAGTPAADDVEGTDEAETNGADEVDGDEGEAEEDEELEEEAQ